MFTVGKDALVLLSLSLDKELEDWKKFDSPPFPHPSANFFSINIEVHNDILGKGGINSLFKETQTVKMLMLMIWVDLT